MKNRQILNKISKINIRPGSKSRKLTADEVALKSFDIHEPISKIPYENELSFDQYVEKKLDEMKKPKIINDSFYINQPTKISDIGHNITVINLPLYDENSVEMHGINSNKVMKNNQIKKESEFLSPFKTNQDNTEPLVNRINQKNLQHVIKEPYTKNLLLREYYKKAYSTDSKNKGTYSSKEQKIPGFSRKRTIIIYEKDILNSPFKNELLKYNQSDISELDETNNKSKILDDKDNSDYNLISLNNCFRNNSEDINIPYGRTLYSPVSEKKKFNKGSELEIYMRLNDKMHMFDKSILSANKPKPPSARNPRPKSRAETQVNTFRALLPNTSPKIGRGLSAQSSRLEKKLKRNNFSCITDFENNQSTSKITEIVNEDKLFPDWVQNHTEFQKAYLEKKKKACSVIPEICEKEPQFRSEEDKKFVVNWLRKIDLFRLMPVSIVNKIAAKCFTKIYKPDEYVCRQGDPADSLYIIYDGLIDVIVDGKNINQCKPLTIIGKTAFEFNVLRKETLIANKESIILTLLKSEYESIMMSFIQIERSEYVNFIKNIKVFKSVTQKKMFFLSNNIFGRFYTKGEVIYKQGDTAENFYIVKQGVIELEVGVDVERENTWPMSIAQWHKQKIIRSVAYKKILRVGCYFGEIEIIRNIKRINKAVAYDDAYVLFIHRSKFADIFDAEDIKRLNLNIENNSLVDTDSIKKEIIKEENEQRQIQEFMVNAISKNIKPLAIPSDEPKITPILQTIKEKRKNKLKENTYKINREIEIVDKIIELQSYFQKDCPGRVVKFLIQYGKSIQVQWGSSKEQTKNAGNNDKSLEMVLILSYNEKRLLSIILCFIQQNLS